MVGQAGVVLAAGKGTRMKSRLPKVLHRVCGREMARLVVDAARDAGFDQTVVVFGRDSGALKQALGNRVSYVAQPEPLGTGHALLQARTALEEVDNVAVLHGDVPLIRSGTLRAMMQLHLETQACITLLTATVDRADGLGRVVRDPSGHVSAVVEESSANDATLAIAEVNGGMYCFRSSWLWPSLDALKPGPSGEMLLTDLISAAYRQGMVVSSLQAGHPQEVLGVNTRVQLAQAEAALRQQILEDWMLSGVTIPDPATAYVDLQARLGQDTLVLPNTHITGDSRIGIGCEIGPNTVIDDSKIGNGCRVGVSVVRGSTLEDDVEVGPFSNIRPGTHLERGVHIGSYAEVKNSRLGRGTRSGHFSYIGDAHVGANVNIGAGTVTCNYDGASKHVTRIEDDVLIGSDTMLVAPISVGARSETGAGAVVTRDVPPDTLVVGVPATPRRRRSKSTRGE